MLIQMMEISKELQEEIQLVQNKLKNAIQDHQILMGKLNDDPTNADNLRRIQEIQRHIVSLGRCQKQIVQRLRTELDANKAENANEEKISLIKLAGLNNNNHIITNNERTDGVDEVKVQNGIDRSRRSSKENYEEIVRNCDNQSIIRAKERSNSVETILAEDDVIEVSNDENFNPKTDDTSESEPTLSEECKLEIRQVNFLANLGLITSSNLNELQSRRAERKRRSTANPQFVYSSWETPTKKKYSYLQSAGNAPQTRQTTAKLNVPSPPPSKSQKPSSPSAKTIPKSIITAQKTNVRPNILRSMQESRGPLNDKLRVENGIIPGPIALASAKTESKALHIPGLPSSLTIERIENDTAVCIHCKNPGTLTVCDLCSVNYHLSCHSISPPPPRLCPKCAIKKDEEDTSTTIVEKDEELEEKERERNAQRERNSDLRLQVYELEKRSQLLSQSLQLQRRSRQELLGKQEKTQRSIKRIMEFIQVIQTQPEGSLASTSSQHRHSSSPSSEVVSRASQKSLSPIRQPSSPASSSQQSPTHLSSSTTSPINIRITLTPSPSPTPINYHPRIQNHLTNNHTSSSRNLRIPTSYQRTNPEKLELIPTYPTLPNHRPFSTISSEEKNPSGLSQDSIPSIPATKPVWNVHQRPQNSTNWNLTNQQQVIYTTHCSQTITSPISSPIVLLNHNGSSQSLPERIPLSIDSPEDCQRTERRVIDRDTPPPSSPNT